MSYSVLITEMAHIGEPDSERIVEGFATFEMAREYARRWFRDSLEELRKSYEDSKKLKEAWYIFGEDASVIGKKSYIASSELDYFLAHPASAEERNWQTMKPTV